MQGVRQTIVVDAMPSTMMKMEIMSQLDVQVSEREKEKERCLV